MRVTITEDGRVNVDGVSRTVDLSALDPNIHAVQPGTRRPATSNSRITRPKKF